MTDRTAFFPPVPPVSGTVLDTAVRSNFKMNGKDVVAPEELADDVGEYFYPALGTLRYGERVYSGLERPRATWSPWQPLREERLGRGRRTRQDGHGTEQGSRSG